MFRRTKTQAVKDRAATSKDFALALSRDRKFRKELALGDRAWRQGEASRVQAGRLLRRRDAHGQRQAAPPRAGHDDEEPPGRLEPRRGKQKRSHKLRNTMLVLGGGAAASPRRRQASAPSSGRQSGMPTSTIDESIEVDVPVSTAYNQWTQFEDFPLFMEGVDDVQQLDDTRLHWVATVAGRRPSGTRRSSSSTRTSRSAGSARTARRRAAPSASSRSATTRRRSASR